MFTAKIIIEVTNPQGGVYRRQRLVGGDNYEEVAEAIKDQVFHNMPEWVTSALDKPEFTGGLVEAKPEAPTKAAKQKT